MILNDVTQKIKVLKGGNLKISDNPKKGVRKNSLLENKESNDMLEAKDLTYVFSGSKEHFLIPNDVKDKYITDGVVSGRPKSMYLIDNWKISSDSKVKVTVEGKTTKRKKKDNLNKIGYKELGFRRANTLNANRVMAFNVDSLGGERVFLPKVEELEDDSIIATVNLIIDLHQRPLHVPKSFNKDKFIDLILDFVDTMHPKISDKIWSFLGEDYKKFVDRWKIVDLHKKYLPTSSKDDKKTKRSA